MQDTPRPENILPQDVLQAYEEMGGIDYLLSQPALLQRILTRLVTKETPVAEITIDLSKDMPFLDFTNRLAYRFGEPSPLVVEATHPPTITETKHLSWKERLPDPDVNLMLRELKRPGSSV